MTNSNVYAVTATVHYSEGAGLSIDTGVTPALDSEQFDNLSDKEQVVSLIAGALNCAVILVADELLSMMKNGEPIGDFMEQLTLRAGETDLVKGSHSIPQPANEV